MSNRVDISPTNGTNEAHETDGLPGESAICRGEWGGAGGPLGDSREYP